MKAPDFSYIRPGSVQEAVAILADPEADAMVLAGGQSLMPMMNFRVASPGTLIDLNGIDGLRGIRVEGPEIRIGAMTRYAELAASPQVATHVPLFGLALPHIAHAAIRNRGTIGGSVALADPAAEMPALLLALGATIHVEGPDGPRQIASDAFFLGMYETALADAEIITEISVPIRKQGALFGFYELARRHGDYAMAGVAVAINGAPRMQDVRIAFFGVGDRAVRATGAEAALTGKILSEGLEAAIACLAEIAFTPDLNATVTMKRHLSGVILKRALEALG